jgi:nucleoside-diphosphate-sugar epimerase
MSDIKKEDGESSIENKKVVMLVGGAGYIGLVIAKQLSERGMGVVIVDNIIYKHHLGLHSVFHNPNITFFNRDIRNDLEDGFIQSNNITDVVILAGLVGDPITKKYPDLSGEINRSGVQKLIHNLNGCDLNKLIFISTCSNYGLIEEGSKADENFVLTPLSLYAKDKVSNEEYLQKNADSFDFSYSVLRFATAFGVAPRMRFDLSVNEFVYEGFTKKKLEIYDADTWRPYCHVLDFANLIELTLKASIELTDREVFNAGGDSNNHTKRDLVEMIRAQIPGLDINYVVGGNDPRNYVVDFSKVKKTLNFEPSVSVDDGIKEIIDYLNKGVFLDYDENKNFYGNYLIEE